MPVSIASLSVRMFAPNTAGMESRNAKRTANLRSKPVKQPAVIVMPEREMPGHSAMA
mgnify:FL=1